MADKHASKSTIPILTDVVAETRRASEPAEHRETEALIAELQTQLAASAFALTEQVLRTAFAELEASLHEQITARLRRELPELVDKILREHLARDPDS